MNQLIFLWSKESPAHFVTEILQTIIAFHKPFLKKKLSAETFLRAVLGLAVT